MLRIRDGFSGQTMIVLPRPLVEDALAGAVPVPIVPSDAGYFPSAAFHFVERAQGSPQVILIFCVGGKGWLRLGGSAQPVESGQVAVILPGQAHAYGASSDQAWSIYWCHAAGAGAARIATFAVERNGSPIVSVSDHSRLASLFREIIDELAHGYGMPHLLTASLALGHLLGCIYTESARGGSTVPDAAMRIRRVAAYLRLHLERPARLEELARMANLSVSHFSAVFRRELGFSPVDYLARARIRRACELLDTTATPLKEIAETVGFSDPLYFSRVFRAIHGLSPTRYRSVVKG
jgi:AraC family transcriptional regulator of arabinose operon